MVELGTNNLRPSARVVGCEPYASPAPPFPIDLWLNSNEGPAPPPVLLEEIKACFREVVGRYPSSAGLEFFLADRLGVSSEQVLVTAGADDALYRVCLAMLDHGRELILPTPTFEMLGRYARLAGADVVEADWMGGAYPIEVVLGRTTEQTAMIAVVSPNNPTGSVARAEDLVRLSKRAPHALLLVDLAYAEFADEDLTAVALSLPNALVVRSFSKAWGLAGLRVGYAVGPPRVIQWLRAAGNPYSVSGLSAALAEGWLRADGGALDLLVERVRDERVRLFSALCEIGAKPLPSQANFVLARFRDAKAVWDRLARRGVAVRVFPEHARLKDYLRITCPGDSTAFERLEAALREVGDAPPQRSKAS